MIRHDVHVALQPIEQAAFRAAVEAHHQSLAWSGDSFMAHRWLTANCSAVILDGRQVGVTSWDADALSLLTLEPSALKYDRQVAEIVLAASGANTAYAASWDAHHVAVFGAFASGTGSQAYQFRLLDPGDLREPVPGLELSLATGADLDYLQSTGWQDDYPSYVDRNAMSVVRLDGKEVGIAVHEPHALEAGVVDIGMYVDPTVRRQGVGSSILALTARRALDLGQTPVAGCWWKNWQSRPTIEAAGLVCTGTILRFDLDPDVFVREAAG